MKKKLSVIVPVYNEEKNVSLLYQALVQIATELSNYEFEFIFVNDGSKDNSWQTLEKIAVDSRVVAIDFSRNFGKELALTAGVQNCTGDAAIFLDADLQHPPALIPQFVKKWEHGAEVVAGIRKSTEKKSFIKDVGSKVFYALMRRFSRNVVTQNSTDFKLIDRKVINELVKFTEHNRLFRGLIEWMGFKTETIEFTAAERINGVASYSIKKLINLAVNSFTSFSLFPLKLAGYLGILITTISFLLLCVMLIFKFILHSNMFSAISYIIVSNTFVLGIVLIALGLIALYIGQIHAEVIGRPLYVIREKIRSVSEN